MNYMSFMNHKRFSSRIHKSVLHCTLLPVQIIELTPLVRGYGGIYTFIYVVYHTGFIYLKNKQPV